MFNVRVYGILVNDRNQVLVTDEFRFDREITKFPGGGLEFGEGAIDCIKREAKEEFGQEIDVLCHYYTTDFFQPSAFDDKQQIISIYYLIATREPFRAPVATLKFDFKTRVEGAQTFRWISLRDLSEEDFTFPIDKKVARILKDALDKLLKKNSL